MLAALYLSSNSVSARTRGEVVKQKVDRRGQGEGEGCKLEKCVDIFYG